MSIDDQASDAEERFREAALKARKPVLPANGHCYNCSDETHGVFCSAACREDYELREKQRRVA